MANRKPSAPKPGVSGEKSNPSDSKLHPFASPALAYVDSLPDPNALAGYLKEVLRESPKLEFVTLQMPHSPLTPSTQAGAKNPDSDDGGVSVNPPYEIIAERFAESARGSQRYFVELADRIRLGDPNLSVMDAMLASQAILAYASQITLSMARPRGAHKMDPGLLALEFALLQVRQGITSANKVHEILAERHDVSVQAVKKSLKKYGARAVELMKLVPATKSKGSQRTK